jgi:hypothetical protein
MKAQGDLNGARELQEWVLETLGRTWSQQHPNTVIAAFNLFRSLIQSGDQAAAAEVLKTRLQWLVQADPATLTVEQRNVRDQLLEFVKSGS